MANIIIRNCTKRDEAQILNVCYRTGFLGEDLENKNIFNDIKLFGYLFCIYYLRYEIEHCFVAEETNTNKIVGYIIGTMNSKKQKKLFLLKMGSAILFRVLTYTWWKYPETFKSIKIFIKNGDSNGHPGTLYDEYPAHLHINTLPEYQHMGIGSRLIKKFETQVKENQIKGIHLETTNMNFKALPFYIKNGYNLIYESKSILWEGVNNSSSIIFGKKLRG
jgi:ribosomal protein S18 acetylase RimI-like enzyme